MGLSLFSYHTDSPNDFIDLSQKRGWVILFEKSVPSFAYLTRQTESCPAFLSKPNQYAPLTFDIRSDDLIGWVLSDDRFKKEYFRHKIKIQEESMATQDTCCTIVPYFKVQSGKLEAFKGLCEQFVNKTHQEPKCLYYGFSFHEDQIHCREGYKDAEGLLAHLENVGSLLEEALKIADITRLEVHGPEEELLKLREPLAELNPQFFTLEYGFRR